MSMLHKTFAACFLASLTLGGIADRFSCSRRPPRRIVSSAPPGPFFSRLFYRPVLADVRMSSEVFALRCPAQ